MTRTAYAGTQAVIRALRLLKLFRGSRSLSLKEIRQRSGLNRSTCYRLLTALEAEGLLERGTDGESLGPGPELFALARRALGQGDLEELAQAVMTDLARDLNETVTLEVFARGTNGAQGPDTPGPGTTSEPSLDEVLIVAEALGGHVLGTQPSLGTRWPAHATSTGKVLLACEGPAAAERLRGLRPASFTEHTLVDPERLLSELDRVAERGWATNVEELEPGFVAVAVPLRDPGGRTVAALSVGGPKHRIPYERLEGWAASLAAASEVIRNELAS